MRLKLLLLAVILLASILRIYRLGETPIALEWDEVAIGYDAYSVLKTGRDQFGQFLPLTFRSLDDYKPPIYEYLAVVPIALLGLEPYAVRLPSAIVGILAVILTFQLTRLICLHVSFFRHISLKIALLSAFFLSISPWHLQFSRAAFEVNLAVSVSIAAVYFFLKGLEKPKLFPMSAIFFGFDLFSYHSARVVAPLLIIVLFIIFNKNLPSRKSLLQFIAIFLFFFVLFIPILTSKDAQIRFSATNIFKPAARYLDDKDLEKEFLEKRLLDSKAGFELAGKIFHNNRLIYTDYDTVRKAFFNYLSHFNFDFLFIKGDVALHHAPGFGLLYLWELPFILSGIIYILRYGFNKYTFLLILWMAIVPIPSSVTKQTPHAVRSELFMPTFHILTSLGLAALIILIDQQSHWLKLTAKSLLVILLLANFSFYLHQYYVHTNFELSKNWMFGRREAVAATENLKKNYEKVLVSLNVDMPYIFWLFYSKYPPSLYLKEGGTHSGGFADEENKFDKYEFRNFNLSEIRELGKLLLVGTPKDIPPDANILKTIYYLNSDIALLIAAR